MQAAVAEVLLCKTLRYGTDKSMMVDEFRRAHRNSIRRKLDSDELDYSSV
jgi:hypothetical protein